MNQRGHSGHGNDRVCFSIIALVDAMQLESGQSLDVAVVAKRDAFQYPDGPRSEAHEENGKVRITRVGANLEISAIYEWEPMSEELRARSATSPAEVVAEVERKRLARVQAGLE